MNGFVIDPAAMAFADIVEKPGSPRIFLNISIA